MSLLIDFIFYFTRWIMSHICDHVTTKEEETESRMLVGMDRELTVAYLTQVSAIAERANKQVNRHLRALCNDCKIKNAWTKSEPLAYRILNTTYFERTKICSSRYSTMIVMYSFQTLKRSLIHPNYYALTSLKC